MPIVNSEYTSTSMRGSRLRIVEKHIDHIGKPYWRKYRCPDDWDIDQRLLNYSDLLNTTLLQNEAQEIQNLIEEGADPTAIIVNHLTNDGKNKAIIKGLMQGEAVKVIPTAILVNSISNAKLDSLFGVTNRNKIRARIQDIKDNQLLIERLESQREEL